MNRKQFVTKSAAVIATTGALTQLFGQDHKHDSNTMSSPGKNSKYAKAMMAAIHCKLAAEVCLGHCIAEMANGDKSLGACATSTMEVIAACEAFTTLASQSSKFTKKLASLCEDICEACAKECKKHADHHKECKDCMESCNACAKEMDKI
jgi:Cys-rich four helix bundle protein (predicted Tat secretion target)